MNVVDFPEVGTNANFTKSVTYTGVNLTGSTLAMMVRRRAGDNQVFVSIDSAGLGGITITDAVNGKFQFTLPRAALAAMPPGIYVHDLVRSVAGVPVERIWRGSLTIAQGPTR